MASKTILTKRIVFFLIFIFVARIILSPVILLYFTLFQTIKTFRKKSIISIITTGGTAGHIFPAIRFAAKAIKLNQKIHFVSNITGKPLIQKLGIIHNHLFTYTEDNQNPYKPIPITFLGITPISLKNVQSLMNFTVSMFSGFALFLRKGFVIENTIGFGGYASFPMLFWSTIFCKKIYIHEQNMVFGSVNELFLPFAQKIFTAFPVETKTPNCHYVGMPLSHKIEIQPILYRTTEKSDKINILIISGSSAGTESINAIMPAIILLSKRYKNILHIYHQVHSSFVSSIKEKYSEHGISSTVQPFFENIHELLPQIKLCISRSGASSIVDLLSFGVTTIFIPLKNSARNHQLKNAGWVASNNIGFLYKPWESNVYNFTALMAFCLSASVTREHSIKAQTIIKKNARAVMYNTIWTM